MSNDEEAAREGRPTVTLTVAESGVARIELNRPERMNAWNKRLTKELVASLELLAEDETARVVTIAGAGRCFSSGADLRDEDSDIAADGKLDLYKTLTERYHDVIVAVRQLEKPVIASVHGAAAGIGCSLALCCDFVLAAESAYFLLAFVNIGLVPDGGCSLLLPSRIGLARTTEIAMLGERLPARKALEWGLINQVVADGRLDAEVATLADRLAAGPTRAYAGIKRELNNWLYARMPEQLELEARTQQEMARTEDFVEGVSAFLQKRPASFTGR